LSQNRRLIVVSNRLPVVLRRADEGWELKPGSGGLVTALAPALSHRGGLWIGWPGVPVEPDGEWEEMLSSGFRERGYELVPVILTQREVEGFYYGFANSVLWPLFHDMTSSCDFAPRFWYAYLEVNRKFADKVIEQTRADDFVWVQDYQLISVAEMIRERHEARSIGFFLHIPFPPLDIFTKLPWRGQILGALLAYDLIGLQTPRDLRNFLSCLEHLLPEVAIGEEVGGMVELTVGERTVTAGAFPIGIDFRDFADTAVEPETEVRMADLRGKIGDYEIVLGVDRLDYTKGLPERLQAFADALVRHGERLRERVILLQVVVPSRENVPEYQTLKDHLDRLVGQINGQHSTAGWMPIHYHYRSLARRDLISLYRMGRVGFVTSIKDGMNLVSKEYVACQTDLTGALVLSEFAGAAAQLEGGAILVNPHDIEGMADAVVQALELPAEERRGRMERMRRVVAEQDIFWWVDRFLSVALGSGLADLTPPRDFVPTIDTEGSWIDV
jgi:trehalose 6-phosphate synthase/phosphatase